jgi:hypothetical protein
LARQQWHDLSPEKRRLIIGGAIFEGTLKILALADLRRRPADQVRGSKRLWALAISFINACGAVPLIYLVLGRRSPEELPTELT